MGAPPLPALKGRFSWASIVPQNGTGVKRSVVEHMDFQWKTGKSGGKGAHLGKILVDKGEKGDYNEA